MADHKGDAMACLIEAYNHLGTAMPGETGEYKADVIATAQVHATLYLAEQQSTANQIALISNAARGVAEGLVHADDYMTLFHQLNPQVMKAMGLGQEASDD